MTDQNKEVRNEAIANILQTLKDYDFRDSNGNPLFEHPVFDIESRNIVALKAIESYGFFDPLGHPLGNCVNFRELIKLISTK